MGRARIQPTAMLCTQEILLHILRLCGLISTGTIGDFRRVWHGPEALEISTV